MNAHHHKALINLVVRLSSPAEPLPTGVVASVDTLAGIKVVIFDIYGTLLVSAAGDLGLHVASDRSNLLAEALIDGGIDGDLDCAGIEGVARMRRAIEESHKADHTAGIDYPEVEIRTIWKSVLSSLVDDGVLTCKPDDHQIDMVAMGYECRVNPCWPMPGMVDLLLLLQSSNIKTGIISNAQFYTPLIIEALTGQTLSDLGFSKALCSWSWQQGAAKPSRIVFDPILESLREKDINPSEALYVGNDMLKDVWAASRCGLQTVLYAGDARSLRLRKDDPRCEKLQANQIWTSLDVGAEIIP